MTELEQKALILIHALCAAIRQNQTVGPLQLHKWLIDADLAIQEPYDPEQHGSHPNLTRGQPFPVLNHDIQTRLKNPPPPQP